MTRFDEIKARHAEAEAEPLCDENCNVWRSADDVSWLVERVERLEAALRPFAGCTWMLIATVGQGITTNAPHIGLVPCGKCDRCLAALAFKEEDTP